MVANRLKLLIKCTVVAFFITVLTVSFVFLAKPVLADQDYSRCTYSSGEYSGDADCDGSSSNQPGQAIAGTGQNIKQIIILISFLGIGSVGFGLAYFLLRKKDKAKSSKDK